MQTTFNEKDKFSKNGLIEKNLRKLYKKVVVDQNKHLVIPVVGKPGSGKSSFTMNCENYFKGSIDLENWFFHHDEWNQSARSRPKNRFISYDEGRNTFNKKRAMTNETKAGEDTLASYRSFKHVHFINFQNIANLIDDVYKYYAHAVIRITHQGWLWGYSRKTAKNIYYNSKKDIVDWPEPDFKDSFPDASNRFTEAWEKYDEKKTGTLEESEEDNEDSEDEERDKNYLKVSTVAERLDVSRNTVYDWIENDVIPFTKMPTGTVMIPEKSLYDAIESDNK